MPEKPRCGSGRRRRKRSKLRLSNRRMGRRRKIRLKIGKMKLS